MGAYVNPEQGSKEAWLSEHGEPVAMSTTFDSVPDGKLLVVHMNNGPFTAAGICYSKGELEAFSQPNDSRLKNMFLVDIDKLHTVSEELAGYMNPDAGL